MGCLPLAPIDRSQRLFRRRLSGITPTWPSRGQIDAFDPRLTFSELRQSHRPMTTRAVLLRETCLRGNCRHSEAAISILFRGETKPQAFFNEVHVQTLVSSTVFAKAVALKVLKVYSPAPFLRRVGCEVMLGTGRSRTDSSDVMPDINGQIVYVTSIPRIFLVYGAAFGKRWELTAKQKAKSQ